MVMLLRKDINSIVSFIFLYLKFIQKLALQQIMNNLRQSLCDSPSSRNRDKWEHDDHCNLQNLGVFWSINDGDRHSNSLRAELRRSSSQ